MLCLLENEHGESLISTLCFRQEVLGCQLRNVIAVEGMQPALCCSILLGQLSGLAVGEEVLTRLCISRGRDDEAFQTLDLE